ncbi:hypothetical protein BGZ61DRAFT_486997 [Ilyonectria robusta]|uniref:uncharacterized protein n=1 Tax=Ilyonectria robusta TaxID=1079257 RepID=UPI001E8E6D56|nr:uncharacterized protein BGZ61DRAFT_486997 [Ilyonectria robusta]KAH8654686.1 hypothetical protein BGZ61DRAFT_486997 [Ilyonectria robusta]
MSLTNFVSTALTTAFGLSAAANLSTSVKASLWYLNIQRNHRETSSVSVVPPSLSTRHPRTFTAVVITHCVIATGSSLTFAVLMQKHGDPWSTYLSSSIIVSSMISECLRVGGSWSRGQIAFAPWPLAFLLATTGVLFIVSTVMASQSAVFNELSSASAVIFRCWMVLEWMLIASSISGQFTKIKIIILIETLAMIASAMAFRTESATSRRIILSNVFGAHDFLVCLIPVVEKLWTKSFRREPNPNLLPRLWQMTRPRASSPGASSQIQLRNMSVTSESEA